jgi:Abnormal spindle-like microcephaly-assoc'd, ASPM-SPD-2-Hydin
MRFRSMSVTAIHTIARLALISLLSVSTAQGLPPLTQSIYIDVEGVGITVRYPEGWSTTQDANVYKLLNIPVERQDTLDAATLDKIAQIMISTEHRTDHAEAVHRLKEIEAEAGSPSTFLTIEGWPALQRRHLVPKPQPSQGSRVARQIILEITTAVAVEDLLVIIEGRLPSNAPPEVAHEVEAIGQNLVFTATGNPGHIDKEIEELLMSPSLPETIDPSKGMEGSVGDAEISVGDAEASEESAGAVVRVTDAVGFQSELEVAVSANGRNIVIGSNGGFFVSTNAGQNFNPSNFTFPPRPVNGDPSVAIGRSGNFYAALIILPNPMATPPTRGSTGIWASIDGGVNFNFRADAFTCPATGPNVCPAGFPDQEHIAADRFTGALTGGDQVYSVWRHLNGNYGIVCSTNSGTNWGLANFARGDFPRITVGRDGFVYVIYRRGDQLFLNKYNSCVNNPNMRPERGFPTGVATIRDVRCPVPGLDRCNDGNLLSSHTVAVDDMNPNVIYAAYAFSTASDNEEVRVRVSTQGGRAWGGRPSVRVNTNVPGRRFMPWVCSTDGTAFVTWYDRRFATPCPTPPCPGMNNDLTDYFGGSAFLDANGNLQAGEEFRISQVSDGQCCANSLFCDPAGAWPNAPRARGDSESCSLQPQRAGVCSTTARTCNTPADCLPGQTCTASVCTPPGSGSRCDFNQTNCPSGQSCRTGRGSPKYGDYNGNACALGRLYAAWASSSPPLPLAVSGIDSFFSALLVGNVPLIQVLGVVNLPDTLVGATSTATLNVCNTGNANLEVIAVMSSAPQFSVTSPSSGFPVLISPDFCFPFQANFTPVSPGTQSATLTISSNDPANPSQTVQATGVGFGEDSGLVSEVPH